MDFKMRGKSYSTKLLPTSRLTSRVDLYQKKLTLVSPPKIKKVPLPTSTTRPVVAFRKFQTSPVRSPVRFKTPLKMLSKPDIKPQLNKLLEKEVSEDDVDIILWLRSLNLT